MRALLSENLRLRMELVLLLTGLHQALLFLKAISFPEYPRIIG
jgi:hypothetical protein